MMKTSLQRIQPFRKFNLIFLLLLALAVVSNAFAYDYIAYVGTYTGNGSEGIYAFHFNTATGELSPVVLVAPTANPSFIASDPTGHFLYAVNELDSFQNQSTGAVSVFAIDRESGKLRLLQQVSSLGASPAHLSLDRSDRFLMVANYGSGNVAVFPIGPDGQLGKFSAFVQHRGSSVNPERQSGPHAHFIQVTPDNRFAIVADLGIDELLVYRFDASMGSLLPGKPEFYNVGPGSGPRHVSFAPSGKFLYLVNELSSTVMAFEYDSSTGMLERRQTVSTLKNLFTGRNSAAEILTDPQGKFLYVSNRGDDSIVDFRINPANGSLTPADRAPSGGKTPRFMEIDPTGKWLLVANQDSNTIVFFRIDPGTGRLTPSPQSLAVVSPVCIRFVPAQ